MEKSTKKIDKKMINPKIIRIIVFRSNLAIYAQAFDDADKKVLAASSSLKTEKKKPSEKAHLVGLELAKKMAKFKAKIIFDRNGYLYHGQVRALAEGLRQGGINI